MATSQVVIQQSLFAPPDDKKVKSTSVATSSHAEAFRKLDFHLYSISEASRSERLFEEIVKLLLVKILIDEDDHSKITAPFFAGDKTANDALLPALCKRFPKLINENDSFTLGDKSIRQGLEDLAEIRLSDAPAAILGEAFQSLIGPRMRGDKGQFFTPRALVRAMVKIAKPKPGDKIVDPAAGTGGFLVEAHSYRTEHYRESKKLP
jgi:type I restriction enzyme M protein